jgi:hypothetical protein
MIALEAPSELSAGSRFLRTLGAVVSVPVITKAVDRLGPHCRSDVGRDHLFRYCRLSAGKTRSMPGPVVPGGGLTYV